MIELLERGNRDEWDERRLAVEIANRLNRFYPNHPWVVSFQGRALVIRHLAIADAVARQVGRAGFGAMLPLIGLRTAREVSRQAMRFGGQLLEAFQLPRGAWDGRDPICPAAWGKSQRLTGRGFN